MGAIRSSHISKLKIAASVTALCAAIAGATIMTGDFTGTAWADTSDGSGGPENSQGNQGGQGLGSQGAQSGQGNQGGQGSGQGGPDASSDGKGPQAGGPSDTTSGGKPAWAQEGIPEVELGRLSVARSPDHVLDRAYAEALNSLTPEMLEFYNMTLAEAVAALPFEFDELSFIDSPLQNLAFLRDALDGTSVLTSLGVTTDTDTLMAFFLGIASDKTVPITTDTALAVSVILDQPLTEAEAAALAADAEAVRIAVLAGHG